MNVGSYSHNHDDPAIPLQPIVPFTGREPFIKDMKKLLLESHHAHVALSFIGMIGIGKTALALLLAHDAQIHNTYRDGIFWASLGPKTDKPSVWRRWGKQLGLGDSELSQVSTAEQWKITLHRTVGTRRILFILDYVRFHSDMVAFNIGGKFCASLLTTRSPEIAARWGKGKHTWRFPPLTENESRHLLLADGMPVFRESELVADLLPHLGGLPLALVIARSILQRAASRGLQRHIQQALSQASNPKDRLHLTIPQDPSGAFPSLPYRMPISLHTVFTEAERHLPEEIRIALRNYAIDMTNPHLLTHPEDLRETGLVEISGNANISLHPLVHDYLRQNNPSPLCLMDEQLIAAQSQTPS